MASRGADIRAEIDLARSTFQFEQAAMQALFRGSHVAQDLSRRAIRVESQAKVYATGYNGGPNVRTGRLRGSITWRLGSDAESQYADVGSNVEYAVYVEMGTQYMSARPFLRPALREAAHA